MFAMKRSFVIVFLLLFCAVFLSMQCSHAAEDSVTKPDISAFKSFICTRPLPPKVIEIFSGTAASPAGQDVNPVTRYSFRNPLKERAQLLKRQYGATSSRVNQESAAHINLNQSPGGFTCYFAIFNRTSALTTPVHTASGRSPPVS